MATGYDPARSRVSADTLAEFMTSPVDGDILKVPGVGPKTKEKMADNGVETTFQLIGTFLSLKGEGVDVPQHLDAMWHWLAGIGITAHRSSIVQAIAEKCNIMCPGIYDPEAFETEED